jgi:L-ascorbate metabolism protein UlaG (beta-lactamase superfamily)
MEWKGISVNRTGGQHGTGEIGKAMGTVSGFVFAKGKKSIYVAGDTIWCDEVKTALDTYKPSYTVLNAGAAKFLTGDPITMTPADIISVHTHAPKTKIIAVHMDTINHCFVKRVDLKKALEENKLSDKVAIPLDGEQISI